jgi:hypothetical protein
MSLLYENSLCRNVGVRQRGTVATLCIVLMILFITTGCEKLIPVDSGTTSSLKTPITPVLVAKGDLSGSGNEGFVQQNIVIKTSTEWENLKAAFPELILKNHFLETEIDFSNCQILALFDKIHANGGWTIDITNVIEAPDSILIQVSNLMTGNLTCVMTQPFHIVKIPVSDKEFIFEYINMGE